MENRIYTYQNKNYKLKPLTLEVLSSAAPLLAAFRKLQAKYTCDIDITPVEKFKKRISEFELSINQLKDSNENINAAKINELEQKLKEAKDNFENDNAIQSAQKLYNECTGLAVLELLGEREMINKFMNRSLSSEDANGGEININYILAESADFVKEVTRDFFVLIAGAGIASAG